MDQFPKRRNQWRRRGPAKAAASASPTHASTQALASTSPTQAGPAANNTSGNAPEHAPNGQNATSPATNSNRVSPDSTPRVAETKAPKSGPKRRNKPAPRSQATPSNARKEISGQTDALAAGVQASEPNELSGEVAADGTLTASATSKADSNTKGAAKQAAGRGIKAKKNAQHLATALAAGDVNVSSRNNRLVQKDGLVSEKATPDVRQNRNANSSKKPKQAGNKRGKKTFQPWRNEKKDETTDDRGNGASTTVKIETEAQAGSELLIDVSVPEESHNVPATPAPPGNPTSVRASTSWPKIAAAPRVTAPPEDVTSALSPYAASPSRNKKPSGAAKWTASSKPQAPSKTPHPSNATASHSWSNARHENSTRSAFPAPGEMAKLSQKQAKHITDLNAKSWTPAYDAAAAEAEEQRSQQYRLEQQQWVEQAEYQRYVKEVQAREAAKKLQLEEKTATAITTQRKLAKKGRSQFDVPVEIATSIILLLDFRSRHNFAKACKDMNACVEAVAQHWNVMSGELGGAEEGERVRLPAGRKDIVTQSAITVATADEKAPGSQYKGWQLSMLKRVTLGIYNKGDKIRRLELHKIPLLSTRLLRLLIPDMPILEYLGIFHCNLIDLESTTDLLRTIRHGRKEHVQLDFYPSTLDRRLKNIEFSIAIPTLLYEILPQARRQQARLLDRDFMFYQYLHWLHIGLTDELLHAIEDGRIDEMVKLHMAHMKRRRQMIYVDEKSNDGKMWKCHTHQKSLPGCFFPVQQLTLYRDAPICWGCRYKADVRQARAKELASTHDFLRQAKSWMKDCRSIEDVVALAKQDSPRPLSQDQTWVDFWAERDERLEIERHIAKGHLKPGQTLRDLKGRHRW